MISPKCALLLAMAAMVLGGPLEEAPERAIARSSELFASQVYQELKGKNGNLLICPISVQTVLALVQAGAGGDTSAEIGRALSLPGDKTQVQQGFGRLMQAFQGARGVELDIANRVYIAQGFQLHDNFRSVATQSFAAGVENLDFNNAASAAANINHWVEEKTHDKIKDLIKADQLTSDTRMVLVNALYFKGKWQKEFEVSSTFDRDFYVDGTRAVKVPMMHQTDSFRYAENAALDCKFVELPYAGGEFSMTIALPNERTGLPALEARMAEVLAPQQYSHERVELIMPRFTIEETINFNEVLQKMGMSRAFSDGADFSGLSANGEGLKISKVLQKNFINVTEAGTEAASATAVGVVTLSLPVPPSRPLPFHVDRPFVFALRARPPLYLQRTLRTAPLLFMGRFGYSH